MKMTIKSEGAFVKWYALFTFIVVVNILTLSSPLTLLITVPEYVVVIYLLMKNDIRKSVLYHFTFVMLSLSAQGTLGMFESQNFMLYNYGTIKLVGPVRACYAMNIVFCMTLLGRGIKLAKNTLFFRLYKTLGFMCISALLIGAGGLLFNRYYSFESFVGYGIYAFVILSSMFILTRIASKNFIKDAYNMVLAGIMAGISGSFICYISGMVVSHYSVYDIAYVADVTFISLVLMVGIPYIENKLLLYVNLIIYAMMTMSSTGGKGVFGLIFCLGVLCYLLFFDKSTNNRLKKTSRLLRPLVVVLGVGAIVYFVQNLSSMSMTSYKVESAVSMVSGDLNNMSLSPYVRVASFLNILYDGLSNPLSLIFGNGYGGYFEDNLHLFSGMDLSNGAFKDEVIASGKFTSGHDAMVTVPLFNGLLGFYFLLKICWLYIKKIPQNYMCSIAFLWLFLVFYFNTIFAMIGLFGLLAAENKICDSTSCTNRHKN